MPKIPPHSTITTKFYVLLPRVLRPEFVARQGEPPCFVDSMLEPDVSVMRGTLGDFGTRHPVTAELVVEVAVSSVVLDRENASLYAEAGVREYWIVLGQKERVEVCRQPVDGVYLERRTYSRNEVIESVGVIGGAFAVETLFV